MQLGGGYESSLVPVKSSPRASVDDNYQVKYWWSGQYVTLITTTVLSSDPESQAFDLEVLGLA